MSTVLASDLDRTLIHPWRTLPAPRDEAWIAEWYEGRPITVCSPRTLEALEQLTAAGAFVPVTTRSQEQLRRITPVWQLAEQGWAICTNGAVLLHRGRPDRDWHAQVDRVCAEAATLPEALAQLHRALGPADPEGWLLRVRDCEERFLYAICDPAKLPEGLAEQAGEAMRELGWTAVLHGRKLYLLPTGLTKLRCLEHLRERLGIQTLMTAGDSLLDLEILEAADHAWVPADAELVTWDAVPANATVTAAGHVAAAEEIVRAAQDPLSLLSAPASIRTDTVPSGPSSSFGRHSDSGSE